MKGRTITAGPNIRRSSHKELEWRGDSKSGWRISGCWMLWVSIQARNLIMIRDVKPTRHDLLESGGMGIDEYTAEGILKQRSRTQDLATKHYSWTSFIPNVYRTTECEALSLGFKPVHSRGHNWGWIPCSPLHTWLKIKWRVVPSAELRTWTLVITKVGSSSFKYIKFNP